MATTKPRGRHGAGSVINVGPNKWRLRIRQDGKQIERRIKANSEKEAWAALAQFRNTPATLPWDQF
ncbi:MAG: hypothetical protein ACRDZP_08920, partial [Acidimicrobiales bacterium]